MGPKSRQLRPSRTTPIDGKRIKHYFLRCFIETSEEIMFQCFNGVSFAVHFFVVGAKLFQSPQLNLQLEDLKLRTYNAINYKSGMRE